MIDGYYWVKLLNLEAEEGTEPELAIAEYVAGDWYLTGDDVAAAINYQIEVIAPCIQPKPIPGATFNFMYDEKSNSLMVQDRYGVLCTVLRPEVLWQSIVYEAKMGEGSVRSEITRTPSKPIPISNLPSLEAAWKRLDNEAAERRKLKEKAKDGALGLDDLGELE